MKACRSGALGGNDPPVAFECAVNLYTRGKVYQIMETVLYNDGGLGISSGRRRAGQMKPSSPVTSGRGSVRGAGNVSVQAEDEKRVWRVSTTAGG